MLPASGGAGGARPALGRGTAEGTCWYLQDKFQDIGILLQSRLQAGEQLPVLTELFLTGLSENLPALLWGTSGSQWYRVGRGGCDPPVPEQPEAAPCRPTRTRSSWLRWLRSALGPCVLPGASIPWPTIPRSLWDTGRGPAALGRCRSVVTAGFHRGTVTEALPTATGHTAPAEPQPSPLLNTSAWNSFINN